MKENISKSTAGGFRRLLAWIAFFGILASFGRAAVVVQFDLSLNTSVDGGLAYNNVTAAGAGLTNSQFTIGFQIQITSVNGNPTSIGPLATFCSEVAEGIGTGSHTTFTLAPLSGLAAGTAGNAGTASSNIPSGGIGDLRAARLAYLFDQYYTSVDLGGWLQTDVAPTLHAFQLAVWEITHDDGLSLSTGAFQVGTQSGGTNVTRRNNAVALAQTYLDNVNNANIDVTYTSSAFSFYALVSTDGRTDNNPGGYQDIVLAVPRNTPIEAEFIATIPEPSAYASLMGAVVLTTVLIRKRRSA